MSRPSGAPPATNDPASPSCTTLDCLHCSVRHLAVCSALSPDEVQALEQVTVAAGQHGQHAGPHRRRARPCLYIDRRRLLVHLADGRRQINGFVLPGDYLGLSGSDHHHYDIEAIAEPCAARCHR
jgi:CRP/FNR family transcriptional regulator